MAEVTSFTAERSQAIEDAAITGAHLDGDDLVLTPTGFAENPSEYPEINVGSVRGPQGIQGPVGEVTEAELASAVSYLEGLIAAAHSAGAILETMLADGSVTVNKLAANSVTAAKIVDGQVGTAELANDSVTSDKIAANAVGSSEIAANAVGSSELADNAVDTAAIANAAVTSGKLAAASGGWLVTNQLYYYKLGDMVSVYTTSTGWAGGATTATLPAGYRPASAIRVPALDLESGGNEHLNRITINTNGVIDDEYVSSPFGSLYFSVTFRAA